MSYSYRLGKTTGFFLSALNILSLADSSLISNKFDPMIASLISSSLLRIYESALDFYYNKDNSNEMNKTDDNNNSNNNSENNSNNSRTGNASPTYTGPGSGP